MNKKLSFNKSITQRYYTAEQLCQYIGLPLSTIYEYASKRLLPSVKLGGRILFDINDVDAALDGMKWKKLEEKSSEIK